jgi:hypothetical protein
MKEINFPVDYEKVMRQHFLLQATFMSLIHPFVVFQYFMDRNLLRCILVLYAGQYFIFSVGSISGFSIATYFRLKTVSKILQLKVQQSKIVQVEDKAQDEKLFTVLMKSYSTVMNVCNGINLCYSFPTMLGFGVVFFFTIFTTFTAYTDVVSEKRLSVSTISSIVFCVYYNLFLVVVIGSCMILKREVWQT